MQPTARSRRFARMRVLPILIASMLVAGAPAIARETGQARLDKLLAGRTEGKPSDCLPLFDRNDSQTIEGIGEVFRSGRTLWLGRFDGGCESMGSSDAIVMSTSQSQLCRGDIIHVVDTMTHMEHGSCTFRNFVPYTKAK